MEFSFGEHTQADCVPSDHSSGIQIMDMEVFYHPHLQGDQEYHGQTSQQNITNQHEGLIAMRNYWAAKQREHREKLKRMRAEVTCVDDRMKNKICKNMARSWVRQTEGMDMDTQKQIFMELLQHPKFRQLQSDESKYDQGFMNNIRSTLSQVKRPRSNNELFLKRSMLLSMLNGEGLACDGGAQNTTVSIRKAAKALGLHRRNLLAAKSRLQLEDDGVLPLEMCHRRPPRSYIITTEIKNMVIEFWSAETRVSPNRKDVCRQRIGRLAVVTHPIHLLDEPQVEIYKRFKSINPHVHISQRCFEGLKPFFIRKLKDRYTCCCIAHIQMLYIKEAFNYMRKQLHDIRCNCACLVCAKIPDSSCLACDQVYSGVTQLWESLLCNKGEDSAFHEKKCILGTCCKCGTKKLRLCPHEEGNTSLLVPVKVFEECPRQTRRTHEANNDGARETSCDPRSDNDGARGTRKDLKVVHMKCPDFISFMKTKIGSFIVHNFIYRWQAQQYKDCLTGFPDDVVVSVIDFAENYTFKEQNEIQSMHWYSDQVTILVHINYVRVNRVVKKTYHFYISDDKTHDTMFVQHCLLLHDSWLKDQGYELKRHWIWSDGCAAQFKARRPFYFVARFFSITGLEMLWSFPCSGHGKGEHDGAGAVIKRELTHEQLKPNGCTLKCAADCVTFLRDKFSSNDVQRVFWEIKEGEVSRENTWDCKRIVKSRSMHSVNGYSATDTLAIRCRSLSCFCDECMDGRWGRCKNKRYVPSWEYRSIVPLTEVAASDSDESDKDEGNAPLYAGHPDVLSDVLAVGDNFAVNADEGADFFVIKCTTAKTRIGSARQDNWGNVLTARAMVVSGYYYERVEGNVWRLLDDRPPVLMYSHLVRAIKFEMDPIPGEASLYTMDEEVEENIYNSMPFDL